MPPILRLTNEIAGVKWMMLREQLRQGQDSN